MGRPLRVSAAATTSTSGETRPNPVEGCQAWMRLVGAGWSTAVRNQPPTSAIRTSQASQARRSSRSNRSIRTSQASQARRSSRSNRSSRASRTSRTARASQANRASQAARTSRSNRAARSSQASRASQAARASQASRANRTSRAGRWHAAGDVALGVGQVLAAAQAAADQTLDQFPGADGLGAEDDQAVVAALGHVVVVPVEGALRETCPGGELVQLFERCIGDQMREHRAVGRPGRGVDEDGHSPSLCACGQGVPAITSPRTPARCHRT